MSTLEYAARDPSKCRKIYIALVTVALVIAIGLIAWSTRGWISQQYQLWRLRRAASSFLDPPGKVIYDEEPSEATKLLAEDGYERVPYAGTFAGTDWNPVERTLPKILRRLRFASITCFLHERTLPNGERHIFLVKLDIDNEEALGQGRVLTFCAMPLSLPNEPLQSASGARIQIPGLSPGDRVRVMAAQVDPNDPSAFSVRFQINDQQKTLRGKIIDNAGRIELKTQ